MTHIRFLTVVVPTVASISGYIFCILWIRARVPSAAKRTPTMVIIFIALTMMALPAACHRYLIAGGPSWAMWVFGCGILANIAMAVAAAMTFGWEVCLRLVYGRRLTEQRQQRLATELNKAAADELSDASSGQRSHLGRLESRRDALSKLGGGVALACTTAPLVWGTVRTRFDVETTVVPIRLPRLPRVLDGFSIVQVSDIHAGAFLGERELQRANQLVRELRPDLVVMTGDLLNLEMSYLPMAASWVGGLGAHARHGVAAITGNHEYYVDCAAVLRALRDAGARVLFNRSEVIAPSDGGGFTLTGVDDVYGAISGSGPGPRLAQALEGTSPDALRILLCHHPAFHPRAVPMGIDLMLAGHTHGGQIAPVGTAISRVHFGPYAGHSTSKGSQLYINRGLGVSGPPTRVAVRPEITKLVLVAG